MTLTIGQWVTVHNQIDNEPGLITRLLQDDDLLEVRWPGELRRNS
jgi:hypothetical protein